MATLLMRKIRPGYNDPKWSAELQCLGGCAFIVLDAAVGKACGAIFEVPRAALYTVRCDGESEEIRFCCPECNVETPVADGEYSFTNLPTREQWFAENRPPEGFVIKYRDNKFFRKDVIGWARPEALADATRFPTREAAQTMIDTLSQMESYQPKIVAFTAE